MRHLLSTEDLSRSNAIRILDTAEEMAANLDPKTADKKPAPKPTAPPSVAADEHAAANALANLDVHPDLEATLFAAEPLLLNPTDIDIDHFPRDDHVDGRFEIDRDAQGARETVCRAERQDAEHHGPVDELAQRHAQRPVTAADEDQPMPVGDRL